MGQNNGYTILELLIASVISLLVIGAALGIYIIAQYSWKDAIDAVFLQQKARIIMDRIIYGGGGTSGIIEAKEIEIYKGADPITGHKPGDTIYFRLGDNIEKCYYLADDKICFDPNCSPSSSGDEIALNNPDAGIRATKLTFMPEFQGYPLGVSITLEQTVHQGRNIHIRLQSMVKKRN